MKTLYSKENCPGCVAMKKDFVRNNITYTEVMIGRDITREEFMTRYPNVRSVPFVVEDNDEG